MSPIPSSIRSRRSWLLGTTAAMLPLAANSAARALIDPPAASAPAATASTSTRPVRLGVIDLSFHRASAGVVAQVLARSGVAYEWHAAPHERVFLMLTRGEVDLVVSAWLPGSHGLFVRDQAHALIRLGRLYQPYALWGVPDYVPAEAVSTVGDLRREDVAARMIKRIQGIGPGAGISRFSREIVETYRLDESGYDFVHGSLDDCVQAFEAAVAERRWVVVPLWQPQFLHARHAIRELREPQGLLRGVDDATLLLRREARALIPDEVLAVLAGMSLGNEAVTAMDDQIGRERKPVMAVAQAWLQAHEAQLDVWALNGRRALARAG